MKPVKKKMQKGVKSKPAGGGSAPSDFDKTKPKKMAKKKMKKKY